MSVLCAVVICAMLMTGCGKEVPKETDAQKYVQAVLDLMCTGEYDQSVSFSDIEDGTELELRDQMIDEMLSSISEESGLDEAVQERFRDFIVKAFSCCKYTVKDAVETDDNGNTGFDVTVSIKPLMLFSGTSAALETEMENLTSDMDKLMSISEEEMSQLIFDTLFNVLDGNLENPKYGKSKTVIVHYGLLDEENNLYGLSEEDGSILGENLFSMEGLED